MLETEPLDDVIISPPSLSQSRDDQDIYNILEVLPSRRPSSPNRQQENNSKCIRAAYRPVEVQRSECNVERDLGEGVI